MAFFNILRSKAKKQEERMLLLRNHNHPKTKRKPAGVYFDQDEISQCVDPSVVRLETLKTDNGGQVEYCIAGPPRCNNTNTKFSKNEPIPTLVFHQLNANRRLLLALHNHAIKANLMLICISRPLQNFQNPSPYMKEVLEGAICVLDSLCIPRVSILSYCSGTPYAMAFASTHTDRTTGKFVMIAPYVMPFDFNQDPATPNAIVTLAEPFRYVLPRPCVRRLFPFVLKSIDLVGEEGNKRDDHKELSIQKRLYLALVPDGGLSDRERNAFKQPENHELLVAARNFMFEEDTRMLVDFEVLFSSGSELGISYEKISENFDILIWYGEKDTVNYLQGTTWLAKKVNADLRIIKDATHDGLIMGMQLYPEVRESLHCLGENIKKDDK